MNKHKFISDLGDWIVKLYDGKMSGVIDFIKWLNGTDADMGLKQGIESVINQMLIHTKDEVVGQIEKILSDHGMSFFDDSANLPGSQNLVQDEMSPQDAKAFKEAWKRPDLQADLYKKHGRGEQ